jgi:hypothetical protein
MENVLEEKQKGKMEFKRHFQQLKKERKKNERKKDKVNKDFMSHIILSFIEHGRA